MGGAIIYEGPKIKHVGLMLYTVIDGVIYAILQKRGEFNHEKMGAESWTGGCQPTAHGKVEEGETPEQALLREIREELGPEMVSVITASTGKLVKVSDLERSFPEGGAYWVALIPSNSIGEIRLGPSTGGLRLVSQATNIRNLREFSKACDIPNSITAMFEDDQHLLEWGFWFVGQE